MKILLAAVLSFLSASAFADGSGALFGGTSPDNNATTFTASTLTVTNSAILSTVTINGGGTATNANGSLNVVSIVSVSSNTTATNPSLYIDAAGLIQSGIKTFPNTDLSFGGLGLTNHLSFSGTGASTSGDAIIFHNNANTRRGSISDQWLNSGCELEFGYLSSIKGCMNSSGYFSWGNGSTFATNAGFQVGSSSMVILQNGNIGIGTASPATLLHMSSGTLTFDGNTAAIVASGTFVLGGAALPASSLMSVSSAGAVTTPTLIVSNSAKVGVNISAPADVLELQGSATAVQSGIRFDRFGTPSQYLFFGIDSGNTPLIRSVGSKTMQFTSDYSGGAQQAYAFSTNANGSILTVSNTGFLLVGSGTNANAPLEVTNTNPAVGSILIVSSGTGAGARPFQVSWTSASFNAGTPVTISSAVFVGTYVSTQVAGGAGASVTALCQTSTIAAGLTFAQGGGCSCAGGVALTGTISIPNCQTTGCIPTGWTCQDAGGTGGACSAYAICSRLQ